MKKLIRALLFTACGFVVLAGLAVAALALRRPAQRPPSAERIERTPDRLARGAYLVEHVSDCLTCHSEVQSDRWGLPLKPGTAGQGGFPFGKEFAVPGVVCAQNITPNPAHGLGSWTDGEVLRALREGVDKNGDALFPMMPYQDYRSMSDEDAKSVLVYLRTLAPVNHSVPAKKLDFPVNLFVKLVPKPLDGPVTAPDPKTDRIGYGRYLSIIGGCHECHTPHDDKGKLLPKKDYTGGWEMKGPWGRNITPNLTPHPDAYLGRATKAEFVGRFKSFVSLTGDNAPVAPKGRNTIMPWLPLSGLTEDDLGMLYDFLKTLPPIENKVNPFPDAPSPAS
ncbi:MAG: cytochrome C [Thermoanaerobaculia bacterium]|nr:cytochrome C [Thermoanaerobaculia bacterium]